MSIVVVILLILINRWLWHVSQSDATIFSRWQPPLSAAFTYFPMKTVPFCQFPRKVKNQGLSRKMETIRWCGERSWSKSPVIRCLTWTFVYCWISHRLFTYKTKIARSVKRCAKVGLPSHDSCIDVHTSRKSVCNVECSSSRKTSYQLMRKKH